MASRRKALALGCALASACAETVSGSARDGAVSGGTRDAPAVTPVDCGACGVSCGAEQVCVEGACRAPSLTLRWVRPFRARRAAGLGVAVDAAGGAFVGGYVQGSADLGAGAFTASAAGDAVVASYAVDGAPRWVQRFAGDAAEVRSVSVDAVGRVWVGGVFGRFIEIGEQRLGALSAPDGFVAGLDADGSPRFALGLSGDSDEQVSAVLADDGVGEGTMVGYYHRGASFGGTALTPDGTPGGVAGRIGPGGQLRWVTTLGPGNSSTLRGVVRLPGGAVVVVGLFRGTMQLGTDTLRSQGGYDVFLTALEATGAVRWAFSFGGAGDDLPRGFASDRHGNVYVSCSTERGLSIRDTSDARPGTALVALDLVARLRWMRMLRAEQSLAVNGLAVDRSGNVVVGGTFRGRPTFDGGPAPAWTAGGDGFLAVYGANGELRATRAIAGPGDETVSSVTADRCGGVVAAGAFQSGADFGGGRVEAATTDGFVARWSE